MKNFNVTKTILWSIALCILVPALTFAQTWQLVWSDEFDTATLNEDNWEYMYGTGSQYGLSNWGNNERQYYTDREENIYIADSMLHIRAREENYENRSYTSARIRTINKADFLYGKIEARIKTPETQGLWPAFWMMPTESVYGGWPRSGEIDIMELVGHEPHIVHGTVHYGSSPGSGHSQTGGRYTLSDGKFSDDFHVFTIVWDPDFIRWYVDGSLYHWATPAHLAPHPWPFDQKFHMLLNVAVGGNWPGDPDATTELPQEMVVDWVRVYQDHELTSANTNDVPQEFQLSQNYPNPFNPVTNISFSLPDSEHVRLKVYDLMGREIAELANELFNAGQHTIRFDAENLSSGTYIYQISTETFQKSLPMVLVK